MAKVQLIWVFILFAGMLLAGSAYMKKHCNYHEDLTGFGVTSGLAFNNRFPICQQGNEASGGAWSGGCFIPHRVIV